MKVKEILKGINDNIADYYLRIAISFSFYSGFNGIFLIPTVEIRKCGKFFTISLWILSAYLDITFSKGNHNNDESE